MIVDANSIVKHVTQIINGIKKYFNVSVKVIIDAQKIIVGILAHVFLKIVSTSKSLGIIQRLRV